MPATDLDRAGGEVRGRRAAALPPEERRRHLVEATLPLLLAHGGAVTTRQIAEAAGVAEGTIFRAFADKDALIEAVVAHALDTAPLEARLAEVPLDVPLEERLVRAVTILRERTASVWQLLSTLGTARPPGSPKRGLTDLPSLAALFVPDRDALRSDPVTNARRLRALTIAGTHPAFMGDHAMTVTEIVSLFLDGVRLTTVPAAAATATPARSRRTPGPTAC